MKSTARRAPRGDSVCITASPLGVLVGTASPVLSWRGEIQPVPLHRARIAVSSYRRRGGYMVDADEDYRVELRQLWMIDRVAHRPLHGQLAVAMRFAGSNRSARGGRADQPDLTNLVKAVEDAGNGHLWVDDAQVRILVGEIVAWGAGVTPYVQVQAWELPA